MRLADIIFAWAAGLYLDSRTLSQLVVDTERGGTIRINVSRGLSFFSVGGACPCLLAFLLEIRVLFGESIFCL